ncbi:PLP-dependent aminotransferase family protein [Arenimonas donghaensis]|uniref:HTH gntR-type domain-containing protein n=1 Tax=Arenimonas donghaensis DSM 18148 = HO3-R19 TaxID=1121014 RepID=A0A087MFE7_9GAMM|nr:PLP-dependent aminotransferase family protein [Arenimonas donghaensis]KFL35600.1 hypothetical protein N788_07650 [Arenimonas donghaensis DSM 18148 = HO3-R19]
MTRTLDPRRLATLLGEFPRSPAYLGLRDGLQELIGDGRIPLGTRLPSERAVAEALGLSRITITRAYAALADAGFVEARQGAGTFATVPIDRRRAHDHALSPADRPPPGRDAIDLNCAASAATPGVAAAYEKALATLPSYLASEGYLPSGLPELRAGIARMYERRGLATDPGQVLITSGALSATAIIARALARPGDRIMLESPVYPNAIEALRCGGGQLVAAPMADPLGEQGWDYEGIEATLRQAAPRLAYLIPDFQNPTGFLMDARGRERIARALESARVTAIVDETLQPTWLDDEDSMPPPFARFGADVITVGSASKMFWGGLRVGWIRAPHELVGRLIRSRVQVDLGGSLFDQLVVMQLLQDPQVLVRRRRGLRQQRDALATALARELPDWRFRLPSGGLSLWVRLPRASATRLASELEHAGLYLAPGPVFAVEGGQDEWLRLPYTRPADELVQAVGRLAAAWGAQKRATRGAGKASPVLIA